MRDKIVDLLRANQGKPVSGEEISRVLCVSRTAVWKQIQGLKNTGYNIEAIYKKGYILQATPNLLLPAEIAVKLKTRWLGHNIIYESQVSSTNDIAKQAALDGCPHGTIVLAEEQQGGRGRLTRGWFSPFAAGLWFSVVLRPPFLPHEAAKFTLLMAVAVAEALASYPGVSVGIKWPNDILLNGRKLVGILTEMNAQMEGINYIVIGTGININIAKELIPDDIIDKVACLSEFSAQPVDRIALLASILASLERLYDKVIEQGFSFVLEDWRRYSVTLGRQVRVLSQEETFTGLAVDIDDSGALLVRKDDGLVERVLAGDVSIRSVNGDSYI